MRTHVCLEVGTFMLVMEVLFPSILMMYAAVRSFSLKININILICISLVGIVKDKCQTSKLNTSVKHQQKHLNSSRCSCICRSWVSCNEGPFLSCCSCLIFSSTLFVQLHPSSDSDRSVPNKDVRYDINPLLFRALLNTS